MLKVGIRWEERSGGDDVRAGEVGPLEVVVLLWEGVPVVFLM